MHLDEYQEKAMEFAFFPKDLPVPAYCALALGGELGELMMAWEAWKDSLSAFSGDKTKAVINIGKELGDVLWYVAALCQSLGLKLSDVNSQEVNCHLLGLTIRCGTIQERIKKVYRDGHGEVTPDVREVLRHDIKEFVGGLLYQARGCGFSLDAVTAINLAKLADRRARNVMHGSGDDR